MPIFRRRRTDWRVGREIETSVWKHVAWGVFTIFIVVLIGVGVWYFTRMPAFTVRTITVVGGETITHDEVRTEVEQVLRGSYVHLVPNTFTYIIPYEEIKNALMTIPRIRNVDVALISRNEIKVSFSEYVPSALWCTDASESSECYFVDNEGYAFSIAPPLRGGSLVRHIIEGTGRPEEKQAFRPDVFERFTGFIAALESELGFRVTSATHTTVGDSVYHISGGGDILTVTDIEVETALNTLKAILESKEYKHLEPGNFRYVDLRFGNKIFLNETPLSVTTTATTTRE